MNTDSEHLISEIQNINKKEDLIPIFSMVSKKIITADERFLLAPEKDQHILYDSNGSILKNIKIPEDTKSILTITLKSQYSMIINNVNKSLIYCPKIDNLSNKEIENILMIPVIVPKINIYLGTIIYYHTKGSKEVFKKNTLEKIEKFILFFLELVTRYKSNLLGIEKDYFPAICKDMVSKLETKIETSQNFFATMVHDIRTPMNAVLGFLQLLEEDEKDTEKKDFIQTAISSGEMITLIINDLLDHSKLESGKIDLNTHYFSIMEILEKTAKLFFHTSYKKNIKFITFFDPNIPYLIYSDSYRIKQILNNLLSNAFKFTPEGGTVKFEVYYEKDDDALLINIIDSGIGIKEESLKDIFSPYKQANKNTSSQYGGTGLGLAISQQLSVLLGGSLNVKSKEGKGSKFFFAIPSQSIPCTPQSINIQNKDELNIMIFELDVNDEFYQRLKCYLTHAGLKYTILNSKSLDILSNENKKNECFFLITNNTFSKKYKLDDTFNESTKNIVVINTDMSTKMAYSTKNIYSINLPMLPTKIFNAVKYLTERKEVSVDNINKSISTEAKHILIVDDNAINLKLMREIILKLNHIPYLAENGNIAMDILQKHENITFAFVDQHMPDISGTETIKQIQKYKHLSIYGLTGSDDINTKQEMIDSGAISVLIKPLDLNAFRKLL